MEHLHGTSMEMNAGGTACQDVWALGVVSLCLGAGLHACTWHRARKPEEVLPCLEELVGVIDAKVWPGYKELPLWSLPYQPQIPISVG